MVILELKYLPNLREDSKLENNGLINLISSEENIFNITYSNSTINTTNFHQDEKYYHKNYLALLLILMIAFYILSYYLHYVSKMNIKKAKTNNSESPVLHSKYQNLQNLSIATFIRGLSMIYIVIAFNKDDNDVVSFINFFLHILPTLLFFSIYLSYVSFLIEKFYEIKEKKKDFFFNPTLQLFNIVIYVIFSIIFLSSLTTGDYISLMYLGNVLIFILSLVISLLYFYYGVRLSSIYSIGKETGEAKEKKFIHDRILCISLVFGILFITRAVLSFLISINVFNGVFPTFMNPNLWDLTIFIFNEFLPSLLIGYTRQRDEKGRYHEKYNLESFDFNQNYQNFPGALRGNLDKEKDVIDNDLNDPLLEKIDKI